MRNGQLPSHGSDRKSTDPIQAEGMLPKGKGERPQIYSGMVQPCKLHEAYRIGGLVGCNGSNSVLVSYHLYIVRGNNQQLTMFLLRTARRYSTAADINVSKLQLSRTSNPRPIPPASSLVFGETFTDHMLTIPWNIQSGWGTPEIKPYGSLSLKPSCTVLHYAQTTFEGMKAYRQDSGRVLLFRPDMNMARMNTSVQRIALPVRANFFLAFF
ncbi:hypothetical protein M378DRAFT_509788 [Amanita muscaria Koide BX008]|uniref:Uncharacterized protein n=1 Tax=Amanita muscaria (strain Koide BX008) TaxID=946122 RepID=A0A0C2TUV2_AMAMK|nr:hypothetical protein M378DRAFT_509788 [Amanita muscaria Koide BX008]